MVLREPFSNTTTFCDERCPKVSDSIRRPPTVSITVALCAAAVEPGMENKARHRADNIRAGFNMGVSIRIKRQCRRPCWRVHRLCDESTAEATNGKRLHRLEQMNE